MREPDIFVLADRALLAVVDQIADHQWDMELPPTFATRQSDHTPTLREIIGYHAYDDAWVPDMLRGLTMDEAGRERFDGDLLAGDPKARFAELMELACQAALGVTDLERVVHCSFGDYTTREYFWQINYFRGLRAYDIAKVIGADPTLPDALVEGLWEELAPNAELWRSIGVLPAEVPVDPEASRHDQLLGFTGRDPAAG